MHQLQHQCSICQAQPADSTQVITINAHSSATSYHNSLVALRMGYFDEAYEYNLQTIASPEDNSLLQYAYYIKAKVLYYKHLYSEAIAQYNTLLKKYATDSLIISNVYANTAEIYLEQSKFTEALQYLDTWQRLFLTKADYTGTKNYYQNKALCLFHTGKFAEAEVLFLRNIALGKVHADTLGLAISSMNLANLYYNQFLDNKAIPWFQRSLEYAKRGGDVLVLKNAYLNAAVVEENRKKYVQALAYRKTYEQLQDSIWNRDQLWKLAAQERKFSAQLHNHQIKLLEQEALLRNNTLAARSRERNTLLAAAIGLLLVSAFIYYAYRAKVKTSLIISKQKEELGLLNTMKDRLFSIVAHDLRSPVYSLKMHVAGIRTALSENITDKAKTLTARVEQTVNNTYNLLDNMLYWALGQTNQLFFRPEKLHLAAVVNQVCFDYLPMADAKEITLKQLIPTGIFIQADLSSTKIVLRNLLDNAIKYTRNQGEITLSAAARQSDCSIQVKDTGIGMDARRLQAVMTSNGNPVQEDTEGRRSAGFGLELCKMMVERNQGRFMIHSVPNEGTEVTLVFPLNA